MMEMPEPPNFKLMNAELDLMSKIERYLQYVINPEDIKRILGTFLALFDSLSEQLKSNKGKGFFLMPVVRLFSYVITRVLCKAYVESDSASFSFYTALTQLLSPIQIRTLTNQVMTFMAIH